MKPLPLVHESLFPLSLVYWAHSSCSGASPPDYTAREPSDATGEWFGLTLIDSSGFVEKYYPWDEQSVYVRGQPAVWLVEPHLLYLPDASGAMQAAQRFVQPHVLIWDADGVTYRLESDLPLTEAVRVAESLR